MKEIMTIGILLLFVSVTIDAQDTSLYQGQSNIYLRSGSPIRHILLWKIDSNRVEYVVNGNLSEVYKGDILKIMTLEYEITFDEQSRVIRRGYDRIIRHSRDTVRGFITDVMNDMYLMYIPASGMQNKETAYISYIYSADKIKQAKAVALNENDSIIPQINTTKAKYPSAKDTYLTNDLIISKGGDSIFCIIIKDSKTKIEYDVPRFGNNEKAFIYKSEVRDYYFYMFNSSYEAYDSVATVKLQRENVDLQSFNDDLVITMDGNHIWCVITKVSDGDIYFYISKHGDKPKIRISRSLVKEYKMEVE